MILHQIKSDSNTGHGHVFLRPDGVRMRCGGPNMCKECASDLARLNQQYEIVQKQKILQDIVPAINKAEKEKREKTKNAKIKWASEKLAVGMIVTVSTASKNKYRLVTDCGKKSEAFSGLHFYREKSKGGIVLKRDAYLTTHLLHKIQGVLFDNYRQTFAITTIDMSPRLMFDHHRYEMVPIKKFLSK